MALVVTMGAADVGRAPIARSRAEAVADLAALAAAQELALPSGIDPSTVAAEYADRNDGRLVSCSCATGTSEAVVEVAVPARGSSFRSETGTSSVSRARWWISQAELLELSLACVARDRRSVLRRAAQHEELDGGPDHLRPRVEPERDADQHDGTRHE